MSHSDGETSNTLRTFILSLKTAQEENNLFLKNYVSDTEIYLYNTSESNFNK